MPQNIIYDTFVHGATAACGPGPPHYRGFTITDTPHSVGLLWTGDQPDAEIYLTTNTHNTQTSLSSEGFEPAIPAPQTHALDRAATGIGIQSNTFQ
jgi:hypothetical protein